MKNANERLRAIGGLCEPLIIVMDAASGFFAFAAVMAVYLQVMN